MRDVCAGGMGDRLDRHCYLMEPEPVAQGAGDAENNREERDQDEKRDLTGAREPAVEFG